MSVQQPVKRIAIVGGGITGLACAYRIQKDRPDLEVTLFEATDRPGGVIGTVKRDGFTIDEGPDCFITTKPQALELTDELGLSERLIGTTEEHRRSFILYQGKPTPIPKGFFLLAPTSIKALINTPLLSARAKMRAALDWVLPSRAALGEGAGDECLADFVRRRFGDEVLRRIAQPMVAGIYTADPEKLSLAATFPQFLKMEREQGSVIRALMKQQKRQAQASSGSREDDVSGAAQAAGPRYGMFVSYRDGMAELPDALARALKPGSLRTRKRIAELVAAADGSYRLLDSDGEWSSFDRVCIALPLGATAKLLADAKCESVERSASVRALAGACSQIRYATSAIVTFAYARDQIAHPLDGMGMVIPAIEQRQILAASFSSVKWAHRAPDGHVLIRAFVGGALQEHLAELPEDEMTRMAARELADILGISGDPLFSMVSRWPQRMAQYEVGHLERVAAIREHEARVPGLVLAGNGFDGVGIPDCVRHANTAAAALLE